MSVATQPLTGTFVADRAHSSLRFEVTHMRVATFTATFDDLDARIVAGDDGIAVEGSVGVESVSIRTPREFRDHVVFGCDFFDARKYPRMAFRSSVIELPDEGVVAFRGELTIKDVTRPFEATGTWRGPVEAAGSVRAGVDISATIDRRDWNIGVDMPGDVIGHRVTIRAQLELQREG